MIGVNFKPDELKYDLWRTIESRAFPGSVSNHHLGTQLGLLMAAYEMNTFKDQYQKAVVENENDAGALAGLSSCCLRIGDLSMAMSYVKKAMNADPENADALCCAAMIYDSRENYEMANEYFDRCIVSPQCSEAHCRYYTIFLYSHQDYDTLIGFAEESLEIYPHDIFYSTYLAAAAFFTNRYNKLRHVLPDVHPVMLHEICPEMWKNPRLYSILPELKSDDEQTTENNE